MNNKDIIVSVCMITYNHEPYIAQAIEGVLMQKVDFQIQLIIGDDCSTDNTRQICRAYQEKYPDKITLLLPEKNLGIVPNFSATLNACTGKYIALCEGDDYWIEPSKLQKQVDYLEANPNYGLVHSNCLWVNSLNKEIKTPIYSKREVKKKTGWLFPSFINGCNEVMTLSVVFRNGLVDFSDYPPFGIDYWLYGEIARKSLLYYFNEPWAAYRTHSENTITTNKPWVNQILTDAQFDLFSRYFHQSNSLFAQKRSKRIQIIYNFATSKIIKDKRLYALFRENRRFLCCFIIVLLAKVIITPFRLIRNKCLSLSNL